MLWYPLLNKVYPPKPQSTNSLSVATNSLIASNSTAVTGVVHAFEASPATNRPGTGVVNAGPEELEVFTNLNAVYTFTSRGGGLKSVELRQYPDIIECDKKAAKNVPVHFATLNLGGPSPVLGILGSGWETGDFKLTRTNSTIRAEKTLPNGIFIVKEFQVGTNYLITAKARIENHSAEAVMLPRQEWSIGAALPMSAHDNGQNVGMYWYNGSSAEQVQEAWFANRTLGCFPGTPRTDYEAGNNNVGWAAVHNQFFTLAVVPKDPAPQIVSHRIDLPPPTSEVMAQDSKANLKPIGYATALTYPGSALGGNQALERQFTIYAGPKEYYTLAKIGAQMNNNLDQVMGFGGFFGFFAKLLLLSMQGLVSFGLSYGWAIVAITVIVKMVFWPLTLASMRSMKRMQTLQPQMKALQEKYKDDPKKQQQKLMEFYKEHKINPVGSCLPMLLQIPVFFGFYRMLQSAIELRGAHFLWACDLSQPDTVIHLGGFPVNIFPLIMGVTMLYQARLAPASPGMDPSQQKIMKYMPLMMMVFLYNMSAGLTLYWTVQNVLTIIQTKLTKPGQDPADAKKIAPAPLTRKKK